MWNSARSFATGLVFFTVLGGTPLGGCASPSENVGSSDFRANTADANLGRASETAVAFGKGSRMQPVVLVGYNTSNTQPGFPDKVAKWAVSQNGGSTWSLFSELANPWVTATQRPTMNDGSIYHSTASDPAVLWTGYPGIFAYITTATSDLSFSKPGQPSVDVVMAISKNNGQTFGPAVGNPPLVVLSTQPSSGAAGSSRLVDRPIVYAEDPATHVAWVEWANPDSGGCGTQNWIKRLHFLSNGTIEASPVNEIRIDCNLNCVWFDASNIAAYCDPLHLTDNCGGSSGGGTETVLISFPRVNNGITGGCWVGGNTMLFVNQQSCTGMDLDIQYKAAISQNPATLTPTEWKQGVTGSDGSAQMNEDLHWPQCAVPSARGINNRSRPVVVHDDVNGQWHVYYTMETFKGSNGGKSGLRVFHDEFNDTFTNLAFDFEEVNPVLTLPGQPGPCDSGGAECDVDQFMPSGTWSKNGSLPTEHVVTWYDTRLDPNPSTPRGVVWGAVSKSRGDIGTFAINEEIDQAGALAPWPFSGTNGNTPWGDYNGMASDGAGTFFPAWGDNRDQTAPTETQVFVRGFQP